MRSRVSWFVCVAFFLGAGTAQGAWEQKFSAGADDSAMGVSIHSPDGQHVYAAGMNFAVANPLTDPIHVMVKSEDGGDSFTNITGNMELSGFMSGVLDSDLSEGATGLSESCLGQSQFIDCYIEWSPVKNSYGVIPAGPRP
jgi:hypothetical protein